MMGKNTINEQYLTGVIEQLAVKVHDSWMAERQAQGWTYGPQRDDKLKQHPSMVGYDRLPESEKDIDRKTARTTITSLLELGYAISQTPQDKKNRADASLFVEIKQKLNSETPPDLATLHALWRQCREFDNCPPDLLLKLGELILKRGETILAYDALSSGLARAQENENPGPKDEAVTLRLRQLLSLALAQSGAAERARIGLEKLCAEGHDTPETLGLIGRVHKDLARQAANAAERDKRLKESLSFYRRGFEKSDAAFRATGSQSDGGDAIYCGINAAAMALLCGQTDPARRDAERVREISESLLSNAKPGYWQLATLGEAELICGHLEKSREWYRQAVDKAHGSWRELSSTRRQARLLSAKLGVPDTWWNKLFPQFAVVAFLSPPWSGGPMPAASDWQGAARQAIEKKLCESGAIAGYLSELSPADVMVGEALLDIGAEVHLVLPYSRTLCRSLFETAPEWQARLDRLLSAASSITDDVQRSCLDDRVNVLFAARRLFGSASLRAQQVGGELRLWSCSQGPWPTRFQPHEELTCHCHPGKGAWESILPPVTAPEIEKLFAPRPEASALPHSDGISHEVRAMLFADVKNYSKMDDTTLFRFARGFLPQVAEILARHEGEIASCSTAGDGLFLVCTNIAAAADIAFDLRDMIVNTSWSQMDLPAQLSMRISLDAGPVYVFQDAVMRKTGVCGSYVNRAARIEPITPPNEVYASEAFASLYIATGAARFHFEYVGQTQLPKGFGLAPLYCLSRQSPARSNEAGNFSI